MELKLSVSIGATLQVRNDKGEWDWIKPEVGAEVKLLDGEYTEIQETQETFSKLWDQVVGPQFANVVRELLGQQETEAQQEDSGLDATEVTVEEIDEY